MTSAWERMQENLSLESSRDKMILYHDHAILSWRLGGLALKLPTNRGASLFYWDFLLHYQYFLLKMPTMKKVFRSFGAFTQRMMTV